MMTVAGHFDYFSINFINKKAPIQGLFYLSILLTY